MKTAAPSGIAEALAELDSAGPLCLLIRHARRERIEEASAMSAFNAPLTAAGHEQARAYGAALPLSRQACLHFSPVPRCRDTAHRIAEGFESRGGKATIVGPRRLLGATFVKDEIKVIETFAALGLRGFITAWVSGELAPEVVEEPRRAGRELLESLSPPHDGGARSLEINVSHDVVIIALLSLAWTVDDTDFPWPGYLDGTILRTSTQGTLVRYRGEERLLQSVDVVE